MLHRRTLVVASSAAVFCLPSTAEAQKPRKSPSILLEGEISGMREKEEGSNLIVIVTIQFPPDRAGYTEGGTLNLRMDPSEASGLSYGSLVDVRLNW